MRGLAEAKESNINHHYLSSAPRCAVSRCLCLYCAARVAYCNRVFDVDGEEMGESTSVPLQALAVTHPIAHGRDWSSHERVTCVQTLRWMR